MATTKDNIESMINAPAELREYKAASPIARIPSAFSSMAMFESIQRMAKLLSASDMIPEQYRNNLPNTVIALEMANRIGASALAVMQSLYIVYGKPGWSSQFIIASLNSCGRYSPLRFEMSHQDDGDKWQCFAWCYDLNNNERIEGPTVSIGMAKAEGWYQKKDSKWKTMPDVMMRYRAASFFGKLYAPEIMMGMQSSEELTDIIELSPNSTGEYEAKPAKGVAGVKSKLKDTLKQNADNPVVTDEPIIEESMIEIDGQVVNTDTGEVVSTPANSANDTLKNNLKKKTGKAANPKNEKPDLF